MRVSIRAVAALSVMAFALMPGDLAAQRRQQGRSAPAKQAQMKVLPISAIPNFSSSDSAGDAIFSPDGKVVALSSDFAGVMLWDTASGRLLRLLSQRPSLVASAFSEDGRQMVTVQKDGSVRIWDIETGAVTTTSVPRGKTKSGKVEDPEPMRTVWADPRGDLFVTADAGANITIWSITSRKPVLNIPYRGSDTAPLIHDARISIDGTTLIVLASKSYKGLDTVTTYDARSGAQTGSYELPEKHNFIDNSIVREDEAIIQVSSPECPLGELMLFSLKEKSVIVPVYRPALCEKPKDGAEPGDLKVFHGPDSSRILIVREGEPDFRIFDVATRRMTNTYRWPGIANPRVLGVSGDMRLAASLEQDGVTIRSLDSGQPVKELRSFAASADRMIASADGAHLLAQRALPEGAKGPAEVSIRKIDDIRPASFQLPSGGGWKIQDFAPSAGLAIADNQKEVALVPLDGKPLRKLAVPQLQAVSDLRLSPDGKLAIVTGSFSADGKPSDKKDLKAQGAKPADTTAAAGNDGGSSFLAFVDTASGKLRDKRPIDDNFNVTGIAFSADGSQIAFGLRDGGAEIFDAATLKKTKALPPAKDGGDTNAVAFSPDGKALIGAGRFDDDVFVWNLDSAKLQRIYKMPNPLAGYRYATSVAMSRDRKTIAAGLGQRAVSSGDTGVEAGGIVLWDADTGKLRTALRSQRGAITALAFSPNDRFLVSGSRDGTVQYWDRNTGRPIATAVAGPNGRWVVSGEGGFYAGSEGTDEAINVVRGTSAVSGAAVAKILSRPDLLELLFKGDNAKYQDAVKKLDLSPVAP